MGCPSIRIGALLARALLGAGWLAMSGAALAADPADSARCAVLKNDSERLRCYDALSGSAPPRPAREPLRQLGLTPAVEPGTGAALSELSRRWELDPEAKQGRWVVRPHQPVFFLLARRSDNPNASPQSPSHPLPQDAPLGRTETEFQLSLKVKTAQNLFGNRADLWFGYTQQSQWQLYSPYISRPFRETSYEPEVFLLFPARYKLLGLEGRFVNFGLVHQSNGRGDPLSRSWNRVYAQFGFERGGLALLLRPWYRLKEDSDKDDNPDIERYLGHGDATAIYRWGGHQLSLLGRYNASSGRGALQATWSSPIDDRLKAYLKLFSGYGETLIDYNWRQTTVGIGILLTDWL